MTIDRTALRALGQKARIDHELVSEIIGRDCESQAVEMADGIDALLDELDAKDRRIAELEAELLASTEQADSWRTQAKQLSKRVTQLEHVNLETVRITGNRQEATDRRVADLTLRLSIATELNVGDRKRIAELEAGLREALNPFVSLSNSDRIRLRKLLPSEET